MTNWFPRITVHSLAIMLALLTYVLTTRLERERRPPSVAIAWVFAMIALPYLALPVYVLFGRRKLTRKFTPCLAGPSSAAHWAESLIESFGLPAPAPARVRMHADGAEAASALFELLDRAERRLDLCTYMLGDDAFGEDVTARLIACAARGVRVRFLIDGVGAIFLPRNWFKRMHHAGAETAIFSPLLARKTQGPRNLRNHRKWVIADGERLWTGGRNLAAEYFCGTPGSPPWRDLSFDLDGPVAASAANQFEVDWVAAGGKPAARATVAAAEDVGDPRAISAEWARSDRGHRARTAHRRVLSHHRTHARRVALLRAGFELGDRHTPCRTARRESAPVHTREIESSPRGFRAQPFAPGARGRRRVDPSAAHHEPREGRGVRSRPRPLRLPQSRFAEPAPQLRIGGRVLRQARDRMARELDSAT